MKKIIRMILGIAAAVILLTVSMAVYADVLMAGPSRINFEKLKIVNIGIFGEKYETGEEVTIPLKFGYYMEEYVKEDVDFSGKAYIRLTFQKEDGTVCQGLTEIDVSDEAFELNKKDGRLKGQVECTVDIPFEDMADTGEIEVAAGLWYNEQEGGAYELLALNNTNISYSNWRNALHLAEEFDWEEYRDSFFYIKTPERVLIYKKTTPLISARLYFVEKMMGVALY